MPRNPTYITPADFESRASAIVCRQLAEYDFINEDCRRAFEIQRGFFDTPYSSRLDVEVRVGLGARLRVFLEPAPNLDRNYNFVVRTRVHFGSTDLTAGEAAIFGSLVSKLGLVAALLDSHFAGHVVALPKDGG
jgi:hypothetical protein